MQSLSWPLGTDVLQRVLTNTEVLLWNKVQAKQLSQNQSEEKNGEHLFQLANETAEKLNYFFKMDRHDKAGYLHPWYKITTRIKTELKKKKFMS